MSFCFLSSGSAFNSFMSALSLSSRSGFTSTSRPRKLGQLIEVVEGVVQDGAHIEFRRVQPFDGIENIFGEKLLGLILFRFLGPKFMLMSLSIADQVDMLDLPAFEPAPIMIAFSMDRDPGEQACAANASRNLRTPWRSSRSG